MLSCGDFRACRSNWLLKANPVSKVHKTPAIKTRPQLSNFPIKTPHPYPRPCPSRVRIPVLGRAIFNHPNRLKVHQPPSGGERSTFDGVGWCGGIPTVAPRRGDELAISSSARGCVGWRIARAGTRLPRRVPARPAPRAFAPPRFEICRHRWPPVATFGPVPRPPLGRFARRSGGSVPVARRPRPTRRRDRRRPPPRVSPRPIVASLARVASRDRRTTRRRPPATPRPRLARRRRRLRARGRTSSVGRIVSAPSR